MNSSVRLVETNFLSSRNSIVSFRALLKFLKFGRINLRKTLFLLVETDFLATRSQFFPFFRYSFLLVKGFFFSRGNIFLNEFFSFRMVETDFLYCRSCFLLFTLFINVRSKYLRLKKYPFGGDLKVTVKQLICFTLSQLLFRV